MAGHTAFAQASSAFAKGAAAAEGSAWRSTAEGKPPLHSSARPMNSLELPPEVDGLLKDRLLALDFAFTISDPTKVRPVATGRASQASWPRGGLDWPVGCGMLLEITNRTHSVVNHCATAPLHP
jgi:hypothetical protein